MNKTNLLFFLLFTCFNLWGNQPPENRSEDRRTAQTDTAGSIQVFTADRAASVSNPIKSGYVQTTFRNGETGYAWNTFPNGTAIPSGPVSINLETGTITSEAEVETFILWMIGADFVNDTWYASTYHPENSGLYHIDLDEGMLYHIGDMGHSMTGLAYDPTSNTMYASGFIDNQSYLFTVCLETGESNQVGMITEGIIIGIAADQYGHIYGICLNDDSLYSINPLSGAGMPIGELGLEINFAQDIAYDRNNGVLYGTLYEATQEIGGFYEINTDTGAASLIHNFVAELAGFGIPYSLADEHAPGHITDFLVQPGAEGSMQAHLSWTNPSLTFGGEALTEISSVKIKRNNDLIQTFDQVEVGESLSFTDSEVQDQGLHIYYIQALNSAGEGPMRAFTVYIGDDVPAAPQNLILSAIGDHGHLSWEAPSGGLNGGYAGNVFQYTITRLPDNQVLAEDIQAIEFYDSTVLQMGNYYYTVEASNQEGSGGIAASNYALLASGDVLMFENFQYSPGQKPPTWNLTGTPHKWMVSQSAAAGGQPPELMLTYARQVGDSRLISYPVTIDEQYKLRLSFSQYLINYGGDNNEIIGFDVSYDGAQTWQTIWEKAIGTTNIHQGEYVYFLDIPQGTEQLQLGIRFNGNSYLINQWFIDDIRLEPAPDNDLACLSVKGTSTPLLGSESVYTVMIQNGGVNTQSDYTVKLISDDGTLLASVQGDAIAFGESLQFNLNWTPSDESNSTAYVYALVELAGDDLPGNNQSAPLYVHIQPDDTFVVNIGQQAIPSGDQPYYFGGYHSLSQNLYLPEEIGMTGGILSGIKYSYSFDEETLDVPIQIWMSETQNDNLNGGWLSPTSMQLVFDGLISFQKGDHELYIPFDEEYQYNGQHLVVYSHKTFDQNFLPGRIFMNSRHQGRMRTYNADSNADPFDPMSPPPWGYNSENYPNITLFFASSGQGMLEGTVSTEGEPLEGVRIALSGTQTYTQTDQNGFFQFASVQAGSYDLEFSKHGYYDTMIENVEVIEYQTTQINASMTALPTISLTGRITGADEPEAGIEGALVQLMGYANYQTYSTSDGSFYIELFADLTYTLKVFAQGYMTQHEMLEAGSQPISLGTLVLSQIAFPVTNVLAEKNTEGVLIQWDAPEGEWLLPLSLYDEVFPEEPDALFQFDDYVYGTVFDVSDFPDARVSFIDFHHMQWGYPNESYPYMVHIVDWDTYSIIQSIGPLYTQQNDDWEIQVPLGDIELNGVRQAGILIQAQGGLSTDAYPCLTADGTPDGYSILAPLNNLSDYQLTGDVGDFLINLWITTSHNPAPGLKTPESYRIYRLENGQQDTPSNWQQLQDGITELHFHDSDWDSLLPGIWKYAVRAEYSEENLSEPAFSNSLEKTDEVAVSEPLINGISVYPNPSSDHLTVTSNEIMQTISLLDMLGRRVYHLSINAKTHKMSLLDLPEGIYFIQIRTNAGIYSQKILFTP